MYNVVYLRLIWSAQAPLNVRSFNYTVHYTLLDGELTVIV